MEHQPQDAGGLNTGTIVARASAPGRGGVAVIRVSGPAAAAIARGLIGTLPEPRCAALRSFRDAAGDTIDSGLAIYFPAPNSFTGEDVLELHAHGSPLITDMLIERICELGARPAEAGEFSSRAFLNDKLDLAQAEAIADLIDSSSRTAAKAAQRSLQGRFSEIVHALNDEVTALRVHVEAALDFPEEEIDFLSDEGLRNRLNQVANAFDTTDATVRQGCLLRDGATVVLAGRPNAGKSSLLNALAGYDAAIVTDIAGTTRDLVREQIDLDGLTVNIIDTAGLRDSDDAVEAEGVRRAQDQLRAADHALVIIDTTAADDAAALPDELPDGIDWTLVGNKCDLSGLSAGADSSDARRINISALTGAGIDELRRHLAQRLGYQPAAEGSVTARRRHLDSLRRARGHFDAARQLLEETGEGELVADELLQVQNALAEITGQFTSDDLLGEIFSNFCIGK